MKINKIQHGLGTDFSISGMAPVTMARDRRTVLVEKKMFYMSVLEIEIASMGV